MTNPTSLTKEKVHEKFAAGQFKKHNLTLSCIEEYKKNVGNAVVELLQEAMMIGDFVRATSFAIGHIDHNQKSYLKRLKESELQDVEKLLRKLKIQQDSFEKRSETIYLPKDITRLIDIMTTFGVTLHQVELHLKTYKPVILAPQGGESLDEFEAGLELDRKFALQNPQPSISNQVSAQRTMIKASQSLKATTPINRREFR